MPVVDGSWRLPSRRRGRRAATDRGHRARRAMHGPGDDDVARAASRPGRRRRPRAMRSMPRGAASAVDPARAHARARTRTPASNRSARRGSRLRASSPARAGYVVWCAKGSMRAPDAARATVTQSTTGGPSALDVAVDRSSKSASYGPSSARVTRGTCAAPDPRGARRAPPRAGPSAISRRRRCRGGAERTSAASGVTASVAVRARPGRLRCLPQWRRRGRACRAREGARRARRARRPTSGGPAISASAAPRTAASGEQARVFGGRLTVDAADPARTGIRSRPRRQVRPSPAGVRRIDRADPACGARRRRPRRGQA